MRIALDARTVYSDQWRSTGKNLIDLYCELASIRPDWQVLAFHRQPGPTKSRLDQTSIPIHIEMKSDRFDAWQRWRLPTAAWRMGADVLHCPTNGCPTWMSLPTVVTIHDLIPLDLPTGQSPKVVRQFQQSVQMACRHATQIITPSGYTRDRLVRQFEADSKCVTVNPWAADQSTRKIGQYQKRIVLDRYRIKPPFVLHFGAAEPRKNTRRLIEAWSMTQGYRHQQFSLLIVGLDDQMRIELFKQVAQHGTADSVQLHQLANEADLPTLLSAADVLAYPSLSEGFGLPILNAWATGTAVLTSTTTSLPEVAGDAAVLVDPTDTCAIAGQLGRLMQDLKLRHKLMTAGRRRLSRFTWRATAERFARVIETAAGETTEMKAAA